MKDHVWTPEDGRRVPVSEMTDEEIRLCLRDGIYITEMAPPGMLPNDVVKRLELELFIRERGLRK